MAGELAAPTDIASAMIAGPVAAADWLVIAPVAIPILFGAVLMMFRHEIRWHAAVAGVGFAAMVLASATLLARVAAEGPLVMTMGRWLPPFGISFVADVLGASFALLASFVALVCSVAAARDIDATGRRYGFFPFLMLMMAGVCGSFLTGDVFNLYVWFEVFVISSFGLIVLGSQKQQIDGATKYAILNLVGTTLFLIATANLYGAFGTLNMADIARKAAGLAETAPLKTIAALYLLAFGMKAAAFPVNFWLPASYHTPAVITGAMFGGLLTKVGIYALLRTLTMLFPVERTALSGLIGWVAIATMILGALGALAQSDVRRMAGFLVISGVGIMLAGLAMGSAEGLSGAILYAAHSILAMTALYVLAGAMRELGGSFSLLDQSSLYRKRPLLAGLAFLLILAVSGLPPGSGLWPKVLLVKAAIDLDAWWLAGAILLSGFLITIALGRVFLLAFWRDGEDAAAPAGPDSVVACYVPLVALMIPIAILGVFPQRFVEIAARAAAGLLDAGPYIQAVFPTGGG